MRLFNRRIPIPWWITAWTLALVGATAVIWFACPAWLSSEESGSTTLRNLSLILAAAIGLPLAIWRSVVAERQADAAHRQSDTAVQILLNDRFQKGAEMLGNVEIGSARIGGIHALARLAKEYPDTFHIPIMQLFSAFVVDRSRKEVTECVRLPEDRQTPGGEQQREADAVDAKDDDADEDKQETGRESTPWFESAPAEHLGPFFVADRQVGPVPELPKDIEAVMSQIAQRSESQINLETDEEFRMNFTDSRLPGLIIHGVNFSNFDFTMADLRRIRGWEACFANAVLPGADLSAANMHGAIFRGADMRRVNLSAARLSGADLRDANLGLVDLVGQNLWKGSLFPSRLVGVLLEGADLRGADLGGADMRGASLGAAKLDTADLRGANMSGSDLRAATLRESKLSGADLSGANLGGAGADLNGADLSEANLAGANLGNADLTGANLAAANLSGADFSHDLMLGSTSPARGLIQAQLDQAAADPTSPPVLDGVTDSETNEPLIWNGRAV